MVHTCCAYGCNSRFEKGGGLGFFRFPHETLRRIQWTIAVKRKDFVPSNNTRICGKHFQTGRPSRDKNHPDYVPSIFALNEENERIVGKSRFNKYFKRIMNDITDCPLVLMKPDKIIHNACVSKNEDTISDQSSCYRSTQESVPKTYTFINTNGEIIGRYLEKRPRKYARKKLKSHSLNMEVEEFTCDENINDSLPDGKRNCFNIESSIIKTDEEILNLYSNLFSLEKQKKDVQKKIEV